MNNLILDYEQVMEKLNEIKRQGKNIKEQEILGETKYGLPIRHFLCGRGKRHIVITGAAHGSEIITTDFVLRLMQQIQKDGKDINMNDYTLHFIPILNPEGYLISTSAVRKIIPREMNLEEAEKICKEYYKAYKQDDAEAQKRRDEGLEPDRKTMKHHQEMFRNVDYTAIPAKYNDLRENIRKLYESGNIPNGTMQVWSANGDGIDMQANSKYNRNLDRIENVEKIYLERRYSNIISSMPGPLNCPYDVKKRI